MMELKDDIGRRFKELRIARRMTQKQLAEKCNTSESSIRRAERGDVSIGLTTQMAVVLKTKVTLDIIDHSPGLRPDKDVCRNCDRNGTCMASRGFVNRKGGYGTEIRYLNMPVPDDCAFTAEHVVSQDSNKKKMERT